MGIVCPRKNQHFAVQIFKKFAGDRHDVRLKIVGVRYVRDYEIEYVEKVKAEIGDDSRISLHDVTPEPALFYSSSDVLLFTSLNEVTPLVIPEAMFHGLPVITTDIAGIPEMLVHEVHGFVHNPKDVDGFVQSMTLMTDDKPLRASIGIQAAHHARSCFSLYLMNDRYSHIARELAPVCVLVDMDGTLVDWDAGFVREWAGRSTINRSRSYYMEECVPEEFRQQAKTLFHSPGFFQSLKPYPGAIQALKDMQKLPGFEVCICTSPILGNTTCGQEKVSWVEEHLGSEWVSRLIITSDKTRVRGDILIDDKPTQTGSEYPTWVQVLIDQPYNRNTGSVSPEVPRINGWEEWRSAVSRTLMFLGYRVDLSLEPTWLNVKLRSFHSSSALSVASGGLTSTKASPSMESKERAKGQMVSRQHVMNLPDFSEELKALGLYREDYMRWRKGGSKGAKGEPECVLKAVQAAMLEQHMMDNCEFDEIHILRQSYNPSSYREGYHSWRKGHNTASNDF